MDEFTRIEAVAHRVAMGNNHLPEPTQAQKLAGNYKVGRTTLRGMAIAIEQTLSIFFHNPDVTPQNITPTDDLISRNPERQRTLNPGLPARSAV
jgi:hypothetical protein